MLNNIINLIDLLISAVNNQYILFILIITLDIFIFKKLFNKIKYQNI